MRVNGFAVPRADIAANWAAKNPVLQSRELGLETDTGRFKIGNGSTPWNQLTRYYASMLEVQQAIQDAIDALPPGGGEGGSDAFEFVQNTPSASWSILVPASMNRRPNVSVYVGGKLVFADISATSSAVNITFPSPVAGSAVLS